MMTALASEIAGFGTFENGYWYPGAAGQIFLMYAFTVLFTFMGSYWFGLAFKERPMRSWLTGAFKATIAWTFTIVVALLVPITLYGYGVQALQNRVVGGMTISPFIAEGVSGTLTFGLAVTALVLIVSFFYTRAAAWFFRA